MDRHLPKTANQLPLNTADANNADAQNSDVRRANIELSKIRNSLPLNNNDKKKLVNKFKGISTPLEDISSIAAFNGENGGAVRENVAYMLYAIYCQKYKDDPCGYDMLMDYYNFLEELYPDVWQTPRQESLYPPLRLSEPFFF